MSRPKQIVRNRPPPSKNSLGEVLPDLRELLEECRLELRSLFRSLDRLSIAQDLPPELRALMELDADFSEALWVLDQPRGRYNLKAMTRDTFASMSKVPAAGRRFVQRLRPAQAAALERMIPLVRASLRREDAYLDILGRDL